jgi:putative lipoic acid-binding regulatory protein
MNAILNFPVVFTFHVVGRTAGDVELQSHLLEQVKDVMEREEAVKYEVIPRGSKFTKISIEKQVVNADEISEIYTRLSQIELTVMQF